jgi:hypothetical protein
MHTKMTDDDYKKLCDTCDSLLKEDSDSDSKIAISWLHILKSDPSWLEQYDNLFYRFNLKEKFRLVRLFFRFSLISLYRVLKGLWTSDLKIDGSSNSLKIDFLFISHLINNDLVDKQNDFYFGDIPFILKNTGLESLIVLINHTGIKNNSIPKDWLNGKIKRILLSKTISLLSEVRIYCKQLLEARKLYKLKSSSKLHSRILMESSINALSNSTANNLRIKKQILDLLKFIKPKYIMITYEGHAWEKLVFSAVREINPNIVCIGYQHALVQSPYAIYRSIGVKYDPDIIATSGSVDLKNLHIKVPIPSILKVNIGSSKKIINKADYISTSSNIPCCLVLADGEIKECTKLLLFSYKLATLHPDINFIFRLHPLMKKQEVLEVAPNLSLDLPNLFWSNSSLEEDYIESSIALYRSSNAIFTATLYNVVPVFFGYNESNNIDPLFDISDSRLSIIKHEEFDEIVNKLSSDEYKKIVQIINDYCNKKFSDLNIEPLLKILEIK